MEISIFEIHLSKVMEMALWLGPGTECNKWLSLRLSLNNPSNIWHCSKEICHKNDWVRERERARVGCQMIWTDMDCRKQGTTGWISPIGFACSVNVHNSICLVYAKFNGLSCMVPGYPFWGPYRFTVFRSPFLGRSWSYEHDFLRLRRVAICPPLKHPGSQLHLRAKLELWMGKS